MRAVFKAARAWRCRVYVFEGINTLARGVPPCPCKGLGLVAREIELRGVKKYTFDPCLNPMCSSSDRFKRNQEVSSEKCLTPSHPVSPPVRRQKPNDLKI